MPTEDRDPLMSSDTRRSDAQLPAVQEQVNQVRVVMQENMKKMLERDEKLTELADKSQSVAQSANVFSAKARGARREMQWRELKSNLMIASDLIGALLLLLWWFGVFSGGDEESPTRRLATLRDEDAAPPSSLLWS